MTSFERAQKISLWLAGPWWRTPFDKRMMDLHPKKSLPLLAIGTVLSVGWAGALYSLIDSLHPGPLLPGPESALRTLAYLALNAFGAVVVINLSILCLFLGRLGQRRVLWRRSLRKIPIQAPEGLVIDRNHHIAGADLSLHAKMEIMTYLHALPNTVQALVVRRGYLYYLR